MLWRGAMTSITANRNFAYRALSPISHTAKDGGPAEGGVRAMKSERVERVERVPISAWCVPKSTFISIKDMPAVVKQHAELVAEWANPLW
jgi:hypothetical protein